MYIYCINQTTYCEYEVERKQDELNANIGKSPHLALTVFNNGRM